jgi:hypothetical protein
MIVQVHGVTTVKGGTQEIVALPAALLVVLVLRESDQPVVSHVVDLERPAI